MIPAIVPYGNWRLENDVPRRDRGISCHMLRRSSTRKVAVASAGTTKSKRVSRVGKAWVLDKLVSDGIGQYEGERAAS